MSKTYTTQINSVDSFGNAILDLPDEILQELEWKEGDTLDLEYKDESIILRKIVLENNNLK